MNRETTKVRLSMLLPLIVLAALPVAAFSQVAVPEVEEIEELPTISSEEIEDLIGRIALYPDDLLAIVLPAATYPLQVVEAARFLEELDSNPDLQPDEDWDDSIVALLNYPEVVAMLNEDLDWTWRLGEAVVAQQSDVIAAIEGFRDRAYAAGNLESDDYQLVSHEGDSIQITPVEEDVIYVPYYEPEQVVIYQPRPVYFYYPRSYPVYYYPYPSQHVFRRGHFWGVTTAFTIGWNLHHLNVFHHSFYGHPYYGYTYWDRFWYRRPDIHYYNNYYVRNYGPNYNRYRYGDRWYPNVRSTIRRSDNRVTRTRHYPGNTHSGNTTFAPSRNQDQVARSRESQRRDDRPDIAFRERPDTPSVNRSGTSRTGVSNERERTQARTSTTERRSSRQPSTSSPSTRSTGNSRPSQTRATPERRSQYSTANRTSPTRTAQTRATPRRESQFTSAPRTSQPRATTQRPPQQSAPSRQSSSRATTQRQSSSRAPSSRQSQSRSQPSRQSQQKASSSRQSQSRSSSRSSSRESQRKR